jgi:hypothetical protein
MAYGACILVSGDVPVSDRNCVSPDKSAYRKLAFASIVTKAQPNYFRIQHTIYLPFNSLYTSVMNRLLLSGVSPFVVASYGAVKFAARTSSNDLP